MFVVIVGRGATARNLARILSAQEHEVAVVGGENGVGGDVLRDAGAERADALVACTEKDADNLFICHLAHNHFGVPQTLAWLRRSVPAGFDAGAALGVPNHMHFAFRERP